MSNLQNEMVLEAKKETASEEVSLPKIIKPKVKKVNRFKFEAKTHSYTLDGKPLTGVTTILGVIAKPALIQWAADEAIKYIKEKQPKTTKVGGQELIVYTPPQLHDILEAAKNAHQQKKDRTADIGTKAHKWIERYVKGKNPAPNKKLAFMTDNFVKWATENKVEFKKSEIKLYSEKFWFAGTMDLVFKMNGRNYIGDIKTSSRIYGRGYFAQMAGYQIALEEQGYKDIEGRMIIRCGKDGSFEIKESLDFETDKKIFLACLELYRGLKTY
jgi:hypothetical protein